MSTIEAFLVAMSIIIALPWLLWRLLRTQASPLVVVQIMLGIVLGPALLGHWFSGIYQSIFRPEVITALNGLAWWAVILFVWLAGIELDLKQTWAHRKETAITAGLALSMPLLFGAFAAIPLLGSSAWRGTAGNSWQFAIGIGMACAVTALPILILLMEKMALLRTALGQRVLRYASLDDLAIWTVLALVLLDWQRVGRQIAFLVLFALICTGLRKLMPRLQMADRWAVSISWLCLCALAADWAGLHFMVGAFLAGVVMDADWFDHAQLDLLREHLLLLLMPVFFLSTGLRTEWNVGGTMVFAIAGLLLVATVAGKLAGTHLAGKLLGWARGEASIIGWLLQTKALIMIIFANVLLDKQIITAAMFTALLLMAVASTLLTTPIVQHRLKRLRSACAASNA